MAWYKLDEEGNIEGLLKPLAPLINYVARLNGTDQYWQLSEDIPLAGDFDISIGVNIDTSKSLQTIIGNGFDTSNFIRVDSIASSAIVKFKLNDVELSIPAGAISQGVNHTLLISRVGVSVSVFVDGELTGQAASDSWSALFTIGSLAALGNEAQKLSGFIYGLSVSAGGTVLNEIPLTNKAQGATQLATVGNVNATMVNYDESVWEQT